MSNLAHILANATILIDHLEDAASGMLRISRGIRMLQVSNTSEVEQPSSPAVHVFQWCIRLDID